MTIRWSRTAATDLENIYDFIARDKPGAALDTIEKLFVAADRLGEFPQLGRVGELGTRQLPVPPFVIVYRIIDPVISIEAVFHGSRRY
jgi:toxin ParE1/3/4